MKPLKTMLLHALLSAMLPIIICGCSNTPSTATLLLDCDPDTRNFGYIDSVGNVVIPYRFTTAFEFEGPHAIVIEKGDITVIDKNGDHVLDRLTSIGDFVNGFAVVRSRDNEIALVNRQYEVVVPFKKYARLTTPNDGLCKAWVETDHYFGKGYDVFVDTLGNERFRCNYFQVNEFSDSMLRVGTGRKQGFLDLEGNETIPPRYSDADDFHEGLAAVEFEGTELWGVIDKTGKTVVGPTYKKLLPYSEGLAAASVDGYHNFGYIDRQGNMVIEPKYIDTDEFEDGLAIVGISMPGMQWDYHGVIDRQGREIIPMVNYEVRRVPGGYFAVRHNRYDNCSLYDSTGREVLHEVFDAIYSVDSTGLVYGADSNKGVTRLSGEIVVPAEYANLEPFKNGFALVAESEIYSGFVDMQGKFWQSRREAMGLPRK